MNPYRELIVWNKSKELAIAVYKLTKDFPPEEKYGLTSQINRAAISIPSNIAEGKMRGSNKEFKRFLLIAFASGAELETQLEISKEVLDIEIGQYKSVDSLLLETMKT